MCAQNAPLQPGPMLAAVGQLVSEGLLTRARGRGTFTAQRRMEANEQAYQKMRARYDVVIESPDAEPAQ